MKYVLEINLEGAEKTDAQLDSLLKKMGKLGGSGEMPSFSKWLDVGKDAGNAGEEAGKNFSKKFKQYGMADLAKLFSKQGWALTPAPDFLRNLKHLPSLTPPEMKGSEGSNLAKVLGLPDINSLTPKLDWKKIATGLFLGIKNPYVGSRVLSDELAKVTKDSHGGLAGGLFGKAGIAGFSEIFAAFKVFKASVEIFKWGAQKIFEASEKAAKFYSASLQSGLGTSWTIRRSLLAQIMGVSEQDVFRFGAQMAYLNPKLNQAVKILTDTNKPLTELNWNWKLMKLDLSALSAEIASQLAPAVERFIGGIDGIVKALSSPKFSYIVDLVSRLSIGGGSGPIHLFESILGANIDAKLSNLKSNIPNPQAWMKQLPASSWEHMGLVTMGGSHNYQKEISRNTREMALGIKQIVKQMKSSRGVKPTFGMSSQTAQP